MFAKHRLCLLRLVSMTLTALTIAVAAHAQGDPPSVTPNAERETPAAGAGVAKQTPQFSIFDNLDGWDNFLLAIIKQTVANLPVDDGSRLELMEILLDARYEAINVVEGDAKDWHAAFRGLFIHTWDRLTPILKRFGDQTDTVSPFRFMLSAEEMMDAMEQMARNFGIDLPEVIRRLTTMYKPPGRDVREGRTDVDPELRQMFGFPPALPPPLLRQLPESTGPRKHSSWFLSNAWAASPRTGLSRLRGWAPSRRDLDEYLPLVRRLLTDTVQAQLEEASLSREFHDLYRHLVLAAAWQESCWRHFIKVGDGIKPIRSRRGAVGLMQVMPRVWRGFYDSEGLTFDIFYNARAGSEILLHYLENYAIAKGEHRVTGLTDNLARATYSAYNGGPRKLTRYRAKSASRSVRAIDQAFYKKFRVTKNGDELAVLGCYTG